MKKAPYILSVFLILSASIFAQKIINNPKTPINKNAGRIVKLQEVMHIDDTSDDYYFKYPRNLKIAPDGSLFIYDQEQLLQFDKNGKFLRNYFKKGQGPKEMQYLSNYYFSKNNIIIYDHNLFKILIFNLNGKFIEGFKIEGVAGFGKFIYCDNDKYYFSTSTIPSTKGKVLTIDMPYDLILKTKEPQESKKLITFPVKTLVSGGGRGGALIPIATLKTIPMKNDYLVVSHTQDYLIKIFDLNSKKIIRSFNRKFKRVKVSKDYKRGGIGIGGKTYSPKRTYYNDIFNIIKSNDYIWVMTSTFDKKKGVLIDVFDFEGRYIDNFYLKFPFNAAPRSFSYQNIMVSDNYLFVPVNNENDTRSIKKYKLIDNDGNKD